ncbi:uncharacterized protein K460DRAFT_369359 [Cucurbitaria berberidis CBS 394.84]|uniref:Uncharacterized protein n=1 Tax=Cucurbitaria berberidis CBS 394.84 TaxID=1168544 RepID=A0A9P4G936_9PLEO|nr:uncharacterized protein K460DRAFT_369359 [Cucurbitaria berberidis CBS 394.84]KAF1841322.1 hypothetical protein K460DRAFT_369359 [Cucurbitaria berberidis CBS 394.84]
MSESDLAPRKPALGSPFLDVVSDSLDSSSSSPLSPTELPRPGYSRPYQHRIIPPSIKGHGRLIVAHRVVPYWVGVLLVIGVFSFGVFCAMVVSGHANNGKSHRGG